MPQRAIGHLIRKRRLELGLTQEALAERISAEDEWLTQADVSRIETGGVKLPRLERLQRIADALNLSLGDLLLGATGVDADGQLLVREDETQVSNGTTAGNDTGSFWNEPSLYRRLLDALDQAVIATDPDGTIRYWNSYAEQLYGWPATEAIGRNALDVTVGKMSQAQADAIMAQVNAGQSWAGEFCVQKMDGRPFMAHVTVSPVLDNDKNVFALIGVSLAVEDQLLLLTSGKRSSIA